MKKSRWADSDEVQKRLEAEKTFGRYKGISDVDVYIDLVSKMEQERMKTKTQPETPTRTESTKKIPDKSKAAPTKGKTSKSSSSLTAKDLLSMSDDEFNKLSERDLYKTKLIYWRYNYGYGL